MSSTIHSSAGLAETGGPAVSPISRTSDAALPSFQAETLCNGHVTLYGGDCLKVLAALAPDSIDACVVDPPYHFTSIVKRWSNSKTDPIRAKDNALGAYARHSKGFMGTTWDGGDIAFQAETWAAVGRVLKPGAHLVAFGAPKNVHRLTCAIEDSGFEIRDSLMWLFGVGFPKNHDAKKAMGKATDTDFFREATDTAGTKWEGWGTALKPAYEPIILARKPMVGTVQENLREWGTGAINIDGCRVQTVEKIKPFGSPKHSVGGIMNVTQAPREQFTQSPQGRWPANIAHDGSADVIDALPAQAGAIAPVHKRSADKFRNTFGAFKGDVDEAGSTFRGDSGSAARFFYCAKATKADRAGSKHPTVKPIALMRYLVRLIVPQGGGLHRPIRWHWHHGASSTPRRRTRHPDRARAAVPSRHPVSIGSVGPAINRARSGVGAHETHPQPTSRPHRTRAAKPA